VQRNHSWLFSGVISGVFRGCNGVDDQRLVVFSSSPFVSRDAPKEVQPDLKEEIVGNMTVGGISEYFQTLFG
jgi:hypothetical protein